MRQPRREPAYEWSITILDATRQVIAIKRKAVAFGTDTSHTVLNATQCTVYACDAVSAMQRAYSLLGRAA